MYSHITERMRIKMRHHFWVKFASWKIPRITKFVLDLQIYSGSRPEGDWWHTLAPVLAICVRGSRNKREIIGYVHIHGNLVMCNRRNPHHQAMIRFWKVIDVIRQQTSLFKPIMVCSRIYYAGDCFPRTRFTQKDFFLTAPRIPIYLHIQQN